MTVSKETKKVLVCEERWLDMCRTHHGTSLQSSLPIMFAENTQSSDTIGVINSFVSLINSGITPPAHILLAIAEGFERYLVEGNNAKEPISLDKAFRLSPKQSVGHPLKHRKENAKKGQFVYMMWAARKKSELETGKRISKNDAFVEASQEYKTAPYQEDAMLKEYTKIKADNVFGDAFEVLEEVRSKASALSDKDLIA
ncbi:MAG: hypothetical protein PHE96_03505, partial [Methylococcales bacterium]|nr:hypothetical protein [Methylococcales bacterium]